MYSWLLYLLTWAAASVGSVKSPTSEERTNLPTPRIYGLSTNDGESTISWLLEENSEADLVLGYKVKLWQVGCDKKPKYGIVDGQRVRLKNVMPKLHDYSTLRNLTEFTVEGDRKDDGYLLLEHIEHDVPYLVTVAAFSATSEGSPSEPLRFQLRGTYTCREI